MEKLIRGIHKFQSDVFRDREEMFRRLVQGQNPQALFITCSDSRVVPDLICQTDPGDLFVIRNAGNLVPTYNPAATGSGEAASIEYAIRGLGVRDIIVCGHTGCGAMKAALDPDGLKDMPRVRAWLAHADAGTEIVATQYAHLGDEAKWRVMVQENVLIQLENLRTHPAVVAGLASGQLRLHAWVYKMETGAVFTFDAATGQYVQLVNADGIGTSTPMFRNGMSRALPWNPTLPV